MMRAIVGWKIGDRVMVKTVGLIGFGVIVEIIETYPKLAKIPLLIYRIRWETGDQTSWIPEGWLKEDERKKNHSKDS